MTQFTLSFLGPFAVQMDGTPITNFHSDKARALLAYLAIEAQTHVRTELATLLWPEIDDEYARTNLRTTLYRMRQTLAQAAPDAGDQLLAVTRTTIQFVGEPSAVDVLHFQHLINQRKRAAPTLEQLEAATALYRGELLLGLHVADAAPFEEWLLLRRELLHQQAVLTLHALCTAHETDGNYEQAHTVAGRLLALDPYREDTHRQIMRLLARMGQPGEALQQVERLRRLLHDEMGVAPSPETLALAAEIVAGRYDKGTGGRGDEGAERQGHEAAQEAPVTLSPPQLVTPTLKLDLRDVPDPGRFVGRVRERQQLAQWLVHDRCCVVAILGIGGMGKTSLAAQCIRELADSKGNPGISLSSRMMRESGISLSSRMMRESDISLSSRMMRESFDAVIWHSLINAPLLRELLPGLLQLLSGQQLATMSEILDEQLRLLLSYLRERRVLLVLDNMESILDPLQAGAYRPGYEPYGQLIQQMATLKHQSHLLLTSRERPRGFARLERDGYPVQSLQLSGLDDEAGRTLLAQRGIAAKGDAESHLIKRYSGNPLALKLVADTVDAIFGGDIVEFLAEESMVFDDVRDVLDQHFGRLSAFEQEILFWLAVEREATPLAVLRDNLLHPPPQRVFVEALRDLQRRSLIERQSSGFFLQNVINEYLIDRIVAAAIAELEQGELDLLHRQALLKAQAKEYVRQSQARLILQPIADQLAAHLGLTGIKATLKRLLDQLRQDASGRHTYAGGNIFNLLMQLPVDIAEVDFSRLSIWQAQLQGRLLSGVNFAEADLTHSTFTHAFGMIEGIAISPDGQLLASGGDGGDITLWQLSNFQPVTILRGHSNTVTALAFSPVGGKLASVSEDATLRMWDIHSGQAIWTAKQGQRLYSVAFSPNGRLIATGGQDPVIYLCDSGSADLLYTCELGAQLLEGIRAVAFHPTGNLLAGATDRGTISLWDVSNLDQSTALVVDARTQAVQHIISALDEEGIFTLAFSPDGAHLASGSKRGLVKLRAAETLEPMQTLQGHHDSVRIVIWSPDSTTLFSGSYDQTVRLWDINRGQCDAILSHPGIVWSAALAPDGATLAVCGGDSAIRIWEVKPNRLVEMVKILQGHRSIIPAAAFSPSGHLLAIGDSLGSIRLWQMAEDAPQSVHSIQSHDWIEALAFSPDGRYLAGTGATNDHAIRLWNVATGECVAVLAGHTQRVRSLAFAPDGAILASTGRDFTIRLWDVRNPRDCRTLQVLHGHANMVYSLAFNHDGTQLVSSSQDQTIRFWDMRTGRQIQQVTGFKLNLFVQFSPHAHILACSADSTGTIRLLETSNLPEVKQLKTLSHNAVGANSIAFAPDGRQLVSGNTDQSVTLWDINVETPIYHLQAHTAYIKFVIFSPDGRHFLSSSLDGTARLWDVKTGDCVHIFHAAVPYEGMNITGVTGISEAQRAALKALGAVEM